MKRISSFLIVVALIAGMVGCKATAGPECGLTITSNTGGSVTTPGEGTFTCAEGSVINLAAAAASGYRFVNWTGDVGTIAQVNAASTTITVNADYSITANFEVIPAVQYILTTSSTAGGSVTTPGEGTFTRNAGTVVSLVATPLSGYQFVNWTGDVGTIASAIGVSTTITMNDNYSITANFEETGVTYYTLTTSVSPSGGGSVSPTGGTYAAGSQVSLTATPASGYSFGNWGGDASGSQNPITITINSNKSITAYFEETGVTYYTLTTSVSPSGGGSVSPAWGTYAAGSQVSLTATPASGYSFSNWGGDASGSQNPITITMNSNKSITAYFEETGVTYYTLTTSVSPSGGGSVSPTGGTYAAGSQVSLTATPASGYSFSNWGGDASGSQNPITITMNSNKSITAYFTTVWYTLTTSVSPSGGGSVSPIGGTYAAGSQVSLTATPASGYSFSNWGGDASGSQNPITITMNANYSITANFSEIPEYELTISSTAGGSVTTPGEGTFTYDAGTVVNLAATPASGYGFVNWTGNVGTIANVNAAYTTITMNGDYSITANFEVGDWVFFPDAGLEAALREAIGRPTGRIYKSDLEELTFLLAAYRGITDLTGLENCINLVSLDLHDNRISDISPLAGLTNLEWLDLSYNRISDISPLAGLTKLKWLYLYTNQIGNISPLANLTSLTYLFLHTNQISDISPLANLTNLTRLLLFSNQISDISPLTNLTKLTWLYLQKNQISNISPLANLTNLIQLDLSHNQISGISPLINLTKVTYLSLYSNQISNISPLANLTNLMWLYLHNNLIADIYPLVQNGGLGTGDIVYLSGNPLSEDSINIYIPELVARGVIVTYDM